MTIKGKKLFITGGAGFIGSTLIGKLIEDNRITVYDDFRRDALKDKPYVDHTNLRIIKGDVLDIAGLKSAIEGAQIVVHCAAIAGIDTVIKRPTETVRVNMLGTANVLEAANELKDLERPLCANESETPTP